MCFLDVFWISELSFVVAFFFKYISVLFDIVACVFQYLSCLILWHVF